MNALCSGCGRTIQFANHEKSGRPAPLVRPLEGMKPNIFLYSHPQTGEPTYRIVKDDTAEYVSHFSDCPKAAQFRPSPPPRGHAMSQTIDMQIIRHYPPDVSALRNQYLDLMEYLEKRMIIAAQDDGIRHAPPDVRRRAIQRLQTEYISACAPIVKELTSLEMFATTTCITRNPQ